MATFDQTLRVEIENLGVPVQGGTVSDVVLRIDQVNDLENFPDIIPVTNFVKQFLTNYPNPNDFYQNINNYLTEAIVNNAQTLGIAGTFDSLSVELLREPFGVLSYPFVSQSIQTATGNSDQLVKLQFQDLLIPVQGGTVADATININHVDNLDTFPDIIPLADFAKDFLTNYPNPNDFYQDITTNLTSTILNNAQVLGLAGAVDSVSVELERSPGSALSDPFFSTSIGSLTSSSDQVVRVEIENLGVPVQGGTVSDVVLRIDQVNDLENFPDIIPVTNFVKQFLTNYPNPNDFYQNINNYLTEAIVNNAQTLGIAGTFDSLSVELLREPFGVLSYPFVSQSIQTATGNSDQLVKLQFQDLLIPVQGGTVADATININHVDNLDTFPDIIPLADFAKDFLTNYPNPNDFYQDITTNLTSTILNNAQVLGLAGAVDSVSVELERSPGSALSDPFFSTSTAIAAQLSNNVLTDQAF